MSKSFEGFREPGALEFYSIANVVWPWKWKAERQESRSVEIVVWPWKWGAEGRESRDVPRGTSAFRPGGEWVGGESPDLEEQGANTSRVSGRPGLSNSTELQT